MQDNQHLLVDVPETLETARLTLRCPMPGQGAMLNAVVVASIDSLRQWSGWAKETPSVEDSEEMVRRGRARFLERASLTYYFYLKETDIFIGVAQLHSLDWKVGSCGVGYWIHSKYQGKGYVTEAVERLEVLAFDELKLQRITIGCDERNIRSKAIPEKLGYVFEGKLTNFWLDNYRQAANMLCYAKVLNQN